MRRYAKVRFAGCLSILLVGLLAAGVVADQHESEPADEPIQLQELVVVGVGTRVEGRSITDSPVPVDVVTEQEILETGHSEVGRIIQALIPSFNFSSSTISDGTDSVRPATLRGLGPDQVLVLVNGKRRHGSALIHVNTSVGRGTAGTDLNAIPVSAIKRIEVLRDGASAQYGSDAIAGVINIVLKDSYDGALHTSVGQTYEGDGSRYTARLNKGFQIGEDGVLHAALEFSHRGATNRAGLSGARQYGSDDDPIDYDKERAFNRRNFRIGDAELDQFSGAFNYANLIAGIGAEVYAFGDFSRVQNESGGFYRRANQLDRNPPGSIYPDGFLPLIHTTVSDFSIGSGIVREFENSLKADLAVVHGGNTFNFEITNSHNASWVNCELGNPLRTGICPEDTDLFSGATPTSADAGTLTLHLTTVNLDFSWPLRDALHLAWGVEYRLDRYRIEAGEEYSYKDYDGPAGGTGAVGIQVFPGFKPENEVDELRDAFSLYVDTEFYVSEAFLINPAMRYEHYSDFGSTINGKVAAKLDLIAVFARLYGIATMGKPALSIRCRHRFPCLSQRDVERLIRARLRTTQSRLELRPTRLNRRQIGRIRRQILNPSPTTDNRFGNARHFMRTQVIHHHHVARPQSRSQDLLDIDAKHIARRRSWNRHQRLETGQRKRPDQRHVPPRVPGHAVADALASGGAPIASRHRQIDPRFIDKRQALERNRANLALVVVTRLAYPFGVTFGGLDGLFFRVRPRRFRVRQSVAKLRLMPSSWRVLVWSCTKVRSGCACIHARMRWSAAASSRRFCPPPWGLATRVPVVR